MTDRKRIKRRQRKARRRARREHDKALPPEPACTQFIDVVEHLIELQKQGYTLIQRPRAQARKAK